MLVVLRKLRYFCCIEAAKLMPKEAVQSRSTARLRNVPSSTSCKAITMLRPVDELLAALVPVRIALWHRSLSAGDVGTTAPSVTVLAALPIQ